MSVQVEKLEHNMAKLTIEIEAKDFEDAITKAYQNNRGKITVPGFRKGKVPQALIEKMYGEGVFYEEAANILINRTYPVESAEADVEIVSDPEIDVEQIERGKNFIYTAVVAVRPEVILGAYTDIEVTKQDVLVTDEDVEEELKKEQEKNSRLVDVEDRPVEDGDTIILDYAGTVDGIAFDGGSAEDQTLVIGSGSFIPGFEEQLVGVSVGEEKDLNVTFPEQYHAEELAGKEAVFHCTVKKIQTRELPELDDEFAGDVSEFDTLDEYKEDLRNKIKERKERAADTAKENEAIEKLIEASVMDIPDAMVDRTVNDMYNDAAQQMASQGIGMDLYLQYMGQTEASYKEQMRPQALKRIQSRLVLEEVAGSEGIEISDEQADKEIEEMSARYGIEADRLKEIMGDAQIENLKKDLAVQEAVTFIREHVKEV